MTQCWLSDLFPLQCYECDGVKGGGGLCPGNAPWGERQVGNPHNINIVISDVSAMYLTLVFIMVFLNCISLFRLIVGNNTVVCFWRSGSHITNSMTLSIIRIVTTTLVSRSTVVSSDSRWRRGCTTDGHEMTVFFSSLKN